MRCISYSTAQLYNLKSIAESVATQKSVPTFPDAFYLRYEEGDIFCFSYGCVVFWGLSLEQERSFLNLLKSFEDRPYAPNVDEFDYTFGRKYSVKNDVIILDKKNAPILQMLAVS